MLRLTFCAAIASICSLGLMVEKASAQLVPPSLPPFYAGAAFTWVHHTGYFPNTTSQADVAQYTIGGKAFLGYRLFESTQFEVAYHHLGRVEVEGLPFMSHERSYAVSGSVIHVTPALSRWLGPSYDWIHAIFRLGLAYKNIEQTFPTETLQEGILSVVVGTGLEFRLSPSMFARIEYEFLSTAIGGPTQSIPALNSLLEIRFGGTHRVVNVMNTPLALTLGVNF